MKNKMGKGQKANGHNLGLDRAPQSMHVSQKKDNMAANVGGDAHMLPSKGAMGHEKLMLSGGAMKPKVKKDRL